MEGLSTVWEGEGVLGGLEVVGDVWEGVWGLEMEAGEVAEAEDLEMRVEVGGQVMLANLLKCPCL